jgi:hypothetical protein
MTDPVTAPARETKFVFEGHTFFAQAPTNGNFIDIESRRLALTSGKYSDLMNTNTKTAQYALDLADAMAVISILIPALKLAKYDNYLDVPLLEGKALVRAYKQQIAPWYADILRLLFAEDDEPVTLPDQAA